MISAWVLLGPTVHAAYKNRQANPEDYTGPMDDRSYSILNSFHDNEVVQGMYKVKGSGPNAFRVYAMNFNTLEQAVDDMEYLNDSWPKPQVAIYGMWDKDTGLQIGTAFELDEEGQETEVVIGTPTYPIPDDCWEIMKGNASSNDDLRDVNLMYGQAPRRFT